MIVREWASQEKMNQLINAAFEPYRLLTDELSWIDKYLNFLSKRAFIQLSALFEYELLYNENLITEMVTAWLTSNIGGLLTSSFVEQMLLHKEWTVQDIGYTSSTADNVQNYQGFSVQNQDGQFLKNSSTAKSSGGLSKLQYLAYLESHTGNWLDKFINWFRKSICRIIY